ncbi:hypothetical protein NP493_347g03085 [Ridgeia piscesae]|uniref:Ketimine reductase mu-crystallin n=1 Tax=Ridgeia piscesae TaxID=27915 RepID=A0AAD9L3J8_RIDPI|nr:hypothetical protein NP493_347g03085 [Ridgeia piscesae]
MSGGPRIIAAPDVYKLIRPKDLLPVIEKALGNYSMGRDGGVIQPVRTVVPIEKYHGFLGVMSAFSGRDEALAVKLVSFYPEAKDHPTHQAWVMIFNPATGNLTAIVDGESITAIRTGIASAVASKHLANPNASVLAILGSGIQARSHFEALSLLHSFAEVRIWSRTLANAQKLATEIGAKACSTAEEAVRDADIICTVTFATTPIIQADWVKPGAHINAVGACRADWQELSSQLMKTSVVYCDSRDACNQEAGDVIQSGCDIYAEIGEVINGHKEAFWEKTTVFKSVGIAIEDVVSAKMVLDRYVNCPTMTNG